MKDYLVVYNVVPVRGWSYIRNRIVTCNKMDAFYVRQLESELKVVYGDDVTIDIINIIKLPL